MTAVYVNFAPPGGRRTALSLEHKTSGRKSSGGCVKNSKDKTFLLFFCMLTDSSVVSAAVTFHIHRPQPLCTPSMYCLALALPLDLSLEP